MSKQSPQSNLDFEQTVVRAFDEANDSHRVEPVVGGAILSVTNPLPVSGSLPFAYDFGSMALSNGNTTETYTFKTGGSGGTVTGTVVINYTDSTREVMTNFTITAV